MFPICIFSDVDRRSTASSDAGGSVSVGPASGVDSGFEGGGGESGEMLRDFVKNKEKLILRSVAARGARVLQKLNSVDSDASDGSTLVKHQTQVFVYF